MKKEKFIFKNKLKDFKQNPSIVILSILIDLVICFEFLIIKQEIQLGFLNLNNILKALPFFIIFFPIIFYVLKLLINKISQWEINSTQYSKTNLKKIFILSFLAIFLIWFICFLTFYPGGCTIDTYFQIKTPILSSNQHPMGYGFLIHGFVVILGYKILHSSIAGWAIYSILQMLAISLSIALAITVLAKRKAPKWLVIILILIYIISRLLKLS